MKRESKDIRRMAGGVLSAALAVTMCLIMSGCKSKTAQVTMAEIIEANKAENLLSHYSSVYLTGEDNTGAFERYAEKEFNYYKDTSMEEMKTADGLFGCDDGVYFGSIMVGQTKADSDAYYAYIGIDGETSAHQIVTFVKKDGDALLVSAELASEYAEEMLEDMEIPYRDGDFVRTDMRIDGKTYFILESRDVLCHKDGTEEEILSLSMTFNHSRPEGAAVFLDHINKTTDMRTVTIIADPGTADEKTYSASVPKGENVMIYAEEDPVLYQDSDCTILYPGGSDKNKDLTLYIKTGTAQVTMAEIIEANKTENLLSNYSSVYEVTRTGTGDVDMERYVEKDLRYYRDSSMEEVLTDDNVYGSQEGTYYGFILIGQARTEKDAYYATLGIDPNQSVNQTVTMVKNDGDALIVSAEFTADDSKRMIEDRGLEYRDGDIIKSNIRMNAKTYAVLASDDMLCHTDKTEETISSASLTYDEPRPEGTAALLERIGETADMRTVTIIADPETADEKTYSTSVPKGENVLIYAEEDPVLYLDPGYTEVYPGGADKSKDLTLYIKTK